jgi:LPS-assembly protein
VPFPEGRLTSLRSTFTLLLFLVLVFGAFAPRVAHAIDEEKPIHTSSDKQYWDRKTNKVKLVGHAVVRQPGETLMADVIDMDLTTKVLDAKGNCVYVTLDSIIKGEEMHFNLDTRTGTIVEGRVSNDKFVLSGERINKLASDRFQTHWGEYSTCRDCPESWSLLAEDVDMQIGGYAYMSNVTTKIVDAPAFWLPYMIVPLKTQRQSGFLFPHLSVAGLYGLVLVEPYFLTLGRSADMTLGLGTYTKMGTRLEWEGRYALSPRSGGKANAYYVHDSTFDLPGLSPNLANRPQRWGLNVQQIQELPWHFEEKFKFQEVSDNQYPITFPLDIDRGFDMDLSESLIISYAQPGISAYVAGRRFRNLLNGEPDPVNWEKDFDPLTVQEYPAIQVTTNDQFLFGGPIALGSSVGFTNFSRPSGTFDVDALSHPTYIFGQPNPPPTYIAGQDPIRKATRFSLTEDLYTTFRPFDVLSIVPSATYYGYYYSFPQDALNVTGPPRSNLYRQYMLFQVDMSTQFEKIYETDNPDQPKIKHLIRPTLTYSNIPYIQQNDQHPFIEQIAYASNKGLAGYNFDDYDIVPITRSQQDTNDYFVPLGDSLQIGFDTQLVKRMGKVDAPNASYVRAVEFAAGEAIDFHELAHPQTGTPQPFSRFYSELDTNFGKFTSGTLYYYYPYINGYKNTFVHGMTYVFERAAHQRILSYDRSFTLSYVYNKVGCGGNSLCGTSDSSGQLNFSFSDYVMPQAGIDYNWVSHNWQAVTLALLFQSPAQCWRFTPSLAYNVSQGQTVFSVDFGLNFAGTGFGGVSDMANAAGSH